jgi:DNA-binding NtrC family response regulator
MSEKRSVSTRRTPASTPAGTLSIDGPIGLKAKQARRPPAAHESDRQCPLILLAENRELVRVAFKKALELCGYDVIVVEQAWEALSIAAAYGGRIEFFVTQIALAGINGGLLAHLFQRVHPETRVLFLSGSREEILICGDTPNHKVAVLEQPVGIDVVAGKVSEMIATRQAVQQKALTINVEKARR